MKIHSLFLKLSFSFSFSHFLSRNHGVATSKNSVVVAQPRSSKTGNSSLNAGQGQLHNHGNKSSLPLNDNSNGDFNSYEALRMGCERNQTLFF